ncbi:MAG: hypothetical protein OEY55_12200 [Acidimicrobiia bacterium]|nr:hypothetical protein [Acidimicrobiia bacterium]MDH5505334.1 hypothetical protein [Acidimicrobiia bacterium]
MSKFTVMSGWRVGRAKEESTRTGLLVPISSENDNDALALTDILSGHQFWAVPTGAWRFLLPETGELVVAVRESQIIAEQATTENDTNGDSGNYL